MTALSLTRGCVSQAHTHTHKESFKHLRLVVKLRGPPQMLGRTNLGLVNPRGLGVSSVGLSGTGHARISLGGDAHVV